MLLGKEKAKKKLHLAVFKIENIIYSRMLSLGGEGKILLICCINLYKIIHSFDLIAISGEMYRTIHANFGENSMHIKKDINVFI